jgi:hypothetical protein
MPHNPNAKSISTKNLLFTAVILETSWGDLVSRAWTLEQAQLESFFTERLVVGSQDKCDNDRAKRPKPLLRLMLQVLRLKKEYVKENNNGKIKAGGAANGDVMVGLGRTGLLLC